MCAAVHAHLTSCHDMQDCSMSARSQGLAHHNDPCNNGVCLCSIFKVARHQWGVCFALTTQVVTLVGLSFAITAAHYDSC